MGKCRDRLHSVFGRGAVHTTRTRLRREDVSDWSRTEDVSDWSILHPGSPA